MLPNLCKDNKVLKKCTRRTIKTIFYLLITEWVKLEKADISLYIKMESIFTRPKYFQIILAERYLFYDLI